MTISPVYEFKGMVSSINQQLGISASVFTLNYTTDLYGAYQSRGGFELIKQLGGKPTNWIHDIKNNESYYTSGNKIFRYSDGIAIYDNLNPTDYPTSVKVCDKIYWADGKKIVELNTITGAIGNAQYSPKKYISVSNGFTTVAGNPNLVVYIPNHGLTDANIANTKWTLRGFTETIDGVPDANTINITDELVSGPYNITVGDINRILITYPNAFATTVTNPIGGSGLITIEYPPVDFPAGSIIETRDNRVFIAGNESDPTRIYQSNLVLPNDCSIRFGENVDDYLNLGFSVLQTASFDFSLDRNTYSRIIAIQNYSFGIYVFTDRGVLRGDGDFKNGIVPVFMNDTCVNPLAISDGEGAIYFKGTNALYESANGISFNSISDENEWYLKNCENDKVRVAVFDQKVLVTLGDLENFKSFTYPFAGISDGSIPIIQFCKGVMYCYNTKQKSATLWNNITGNLLIIQSRLINYTTTQELWIDNIGGAMTKYDKFRSDDYGSSVPHITVEHLKFPAGLLSNCTFDSVMLTHNNCPSLKMFYRIHDEDVKEAFEDSTLNKPNSGNSLAIFTCKTNNAGRGLMCYFSDFSNARHSILYNYALDFQVRGQSGK